MATSQTTIDYITDQLTRLPDVRSQKMFGEYALYHEDKVVALVCDNQFFLKPTEAGKKLLGTPVEAPPYPGAKMYYRLDDDILEDRELLVRLVTATTTALPMPKEKRRKKTS